MRVLTLVEDTGNQTVLQKWIEGSDPFELVTEANEPSSGSFDCLIADDWSYCKHREWLLQREAEETAVLPYVLLIEQKDATEIRSRLQNEYPDLWKSVNAVIEMPVSKTAFKNRLQTMAKTRSQSLDLLQQERELETLREEHAGHGVVITDRDGTIQYVNGAFETQSGYDKSELLGETPRILKSGVHDEAFYEALWETICSGEVWQGEFTNERKNGEKYVVSQTIAPVTNSTGTIERFIAVNHEITQLKELESSLREQREQMAILNRVLRHDVRNDLHVILGWAETLEPHTDEEGEPYRKRILRSGNHIIELTEVAKDIVDGVFQNEEQDLKQVPLREILDSEVKKRQESFQEASIELLEEPDPSTKVFANELLTSVFRNLINNAVQHNDKEVPRVRIKTEKQDGTIEISVEDNGPGISTERRDVIFEEARMGLDSTGTGMGLFLVESLVSGYGGDIRVKESELGGAAFRISLQCVENGHMAGDGE